jgi:hypothetical protein
MEAYWNGIYREKLKNLEKNISQCHFMPTNPTWTDPGANPGLYGERLAMSELWVQPKVLLI